MCSYRLISTLWSNYHTHCLTNIANHINRCRPTICTVRMSNSCCIPDQDGDSRIMSSAYAKILIASPPTLQLIPQQVISAISSLMLYLANKRGDSTPPCQVPFTIENHPDSLPHHSTLPYTKTNIIIQLGN